MGRDDLRRAIQIITGGVEVPDKEAGVGTECQKQKVEKMNAAAIGEIEGTADDAMGLRKVPLLQGTNGMAPLKTEPRHG